MTGPGLATEPSLEQVGADLIKTVAAIPKLRAAVDKAREALAAAEGDEQEAARRLDSLRALQNRLIKDSTGIG